MKIYTDIYILYMSDPAYSFRHNLSITHPTWESEIMPYFQMAPEKFSSPRPTYRIGSSIWPSGFLLAKALSEGALFGPETWGYDGLVLRWLHLNCPWEKGSVVMFDLLICAVFKWLKLEY